MPRLPGIRKVLVIGSGPIVIGQAAEFDYSGSQACRALKEEGVSVVLLNPNPATIQTDVHMADRTYLEPLTFESAARIIEIERPDGLIGTMGGQAGLNLTVALDEAGVLDRYGVQVLGTGPDAIRRGEDRDLFKQTMVEIGQPVPKSMTVTSLQQIEDVLDYVGVPCVVRPAFTLGGTGGSLAVTREELERALDRGLSASPVHQVLVEASLYGEKEIEFEAIRDADGNAITVCSMENVDPMGIHTGDSIVVAPALTLDERTYQKLRRAALVIVEGLDIRGACNIQFALKRNGEYYVIEVNPRVSRSSALASKATGYPIARVAAKIALGYRLDEVENEVTGKTRACQEPVADYVALKMPRWPWDKFPNGPRKLGLQMKSTGEVMAIGRSFEEALGKAIASLDQKISLWSPGDGSRDGIGRDEILRRLAEPDDTRVFWIFEALWKGIETEDIARASGIDPFFIHCMRRMVDAEREIRSRAAPPERVLLDGDLLRRAKEAGLPDMRIAEILGMDEARVREARVAAHVRPAFKMVDTCAGEFEARTPYYYSTYEGETEVPRNQASGRRSVVVLGAGPIRIGQGIEFDYCAVHAAWALREEGYRSVIINNNPETVSTDFNTADRLYFEPLTFEHVMEVVETERPLGVMVSFGGQTAINLVDGLAAAGVKVLGTDPDSIDATEDRGRFVKLLRDLGIPSVPGTTAYTLEEALKACEEMGFPVVVRPSYVLGGRGMAIVHRPEELGAYFDDARSEARGRGVLIDKYILATEAEVDVVSDATESYVPVIMEHVERAGVHSGDSIAQIPHRTLSPVAVGKIVEYTRALCRALRIRGIANIQYIVDGDAVYCLEVNPRASRTVPFVTKVTGFPMVRVAVGLSMGKSLRSYGCSGGLGPDPGVVAVKMPVFSWAKMRVDPVVGPEMKSTGEVMGLGRTLEEALWKGFLAQGIRRPQAGMAALVTLADRDKPFGVEPAKALVRAGWRLYATRGTASYLRAHGVEAEPVAKISEVAEGKVVGDGEDVASLISGGRVDLVVNTFTKGGSEERDGFRIRVMAAQRNIPVLTCFETVMALASAVTAHPDAPPVALQDLSWTRKTGGVR